MAETNRMQDANPVASLSSSLNVTRAPGEQLIVVGTPEGNKIVRLAPGLRLSDSKF
jgi:hypothetical protein